MLSALVVCTMIVPAAAKEPIRLPPVSPWNLHYGENSCRLGRQFGSAAKPTTLVLERIAPAEAMTMLVFGGQLRAREDTGKARVSFVPLTGMTFETDYVASTTKSKEPAIYWPRVSFLTSELDALAKREERAEQQVRSPEEEAKRRVEESANAKQITSLQIREPGGRMISLEAGSLGRANAMMLECAREQLIAWGVDPAIQDKIVRPARNNRLDRLFSPADYPHSAMREGAQSVIQARLNIGADGRVTKCTSLTIFSAPDFAEVVCKKLRTARYEPAELADGTKVPSYDIATIRFVMP